MQVGLNEPVELEYSCPERDWIPDNRVNKCQLCQNDFSLANRKHHCRRCGKVVCGPCSSSKMQLPGMQTEERICVPCCTATVLFRDFKKQSAPSMMDNVRGTTVFTIHNPNGSSSRSPVWLSENLLLICWEDEQHQVQSCRVDQFEDVKEGFQSPTFRAKIPKRSCFSAWCSSGDDDFLAKEPLLFSVVFSGNWTLDLEAPSFDVKVNWVHRFRALSKVVPFAEHFHATFGVNQNKLTAAEMNRAHKLRNFVEVDESQARIQRARRIQTDVYRRKYSQPSTKQTKLV